jgi:hypothetical protein
MGGVTMTHLRAVRPTKKVFEALIEGLRDPNPRVRWWCVQILDHSPDPQAIAAIAPMLAPNANTERLPGTTRRPHRSALP